MIFYRIKDAGQPSVDIAEGNNWESIICPVDEGHQRPGKRITILTIKWVSSRPVDFSWTFFGDIIVNQKTVRVLEEAGLSGWHKEPTRIITSQRDICSEKRHKPLWEFTITGDGGFCRPEAGIYLKKKCKACGLKRHSAYDKGLLVDPDNWDGSDFFTVTEWPHSALCTERAKMVIQKANLSNIRFIPAHELRWPVGVARP